MEIVITKNEEQLGPFTPDYVRKAIEQGTFTESDWAWSDTENDWVPLSVLLVSISADTPMPPPLKQSLTQKVNAKLEKVDSALTHLLGEEQDPLTVQKVVNRASELLTRGEKIEYIAVQKKPVVTVKPDAVLLTNKRFMIVRPKMMGMTFDDHLWREVLDVHMSEKMLSATITCKITSGESLSIDSIPKKQARKIYSYAQEIEELMHEERRNRDMEERRAAAGGVVIQSPTTAPPMQTPQPVADDPMEVLGKFKKMLDAGLIEQQEYDAKKTEVLGNL